SAAALAGEERGRSAACDDRRRTELISVDRYGLHIVVQSSSSQQSFVLPLTEIEPAFVVVFQVIEMVRSPPVMTTEAVSPERVYTAVAPVFTSVRFTVSEPPCPLVQVTSMTSVPSGR